MRYPFSKSVSASPETIAARWKITSGLSATSAAASPGTDRSPVRVEISNGFSRGSAGGTTSCSDSFEIALPPSFFSRRSRSTSFRPIMPAAPMTRICIGLSFSSDREADVDQVDRGGGEFRFVGGEINREHRDFLRGAEAAHRLAVDESLADLGLRLSRVFCERSDALIERRRLHRAGADRVGADALLDEIGGDRFGEADHGGFRRAVDVAERQAAHRRGDRRNVYDRGAAFCEHAREESSDGTVHRFHVEVEGEIPISFRAFEHRTVVHVTRAIREHVDGSSLGGELFDLDRIAHVELLAVGAP